MTQKRLRLWIIIVVCLTFLIVLGLLSPWSGPRTDKIAHPSREPVRLRMVYPEYGSDHLFRKVIEAYNKSNSQRVKVDLISIPGNSYSATLNMMFTSGTSPDVFAIEPAWVNTYAYKGWLLDLEPVVDAHFLDRFPDWAREASQGKNFGRKLLTVPWGIQTVRLIYNKELFRRAGLDPNRPPVTLAEMSQYAEQISESGVGYQRYGFAFPAGEEWIAFSQMVEISATYSGRYFYDYETASFDIGVYRPWMEALREMKRNGGMFPGEAALRQGTALTQFAEGNIGMMMMSSKEFPSLRKEASGRIEWGAALPPALDEDHIGAGALMTIPEPYIGVSAMTSHPEEAIKLWKYLYSEEVMGEMFREGYAIPAAKGVVGRAEYMPEDELFLSFVPKANESVYRPIPQVMDDFLGSPSMPRNIGDSPRYQVYLELLRGADDSEERIAAENKRLNTVLQQAVTEGRIALEDYQFTPFDPQYPLLSQTE